ncbi:hypothetical protein HUT17_05075 (plasmid) [Nocardiopsis flavescens]|nr:hypothetical protein HUT17_05075 [Nocardiopsis flavescens]
MGAHARVGARDCADHSYDRFELVVLCEQRRSARLAWTVLAAVPTAALLGAWVAVNLRRSADWPSAHSVVGAYASRGGPAR